MEELENEGLKAIELFAEELVSGPVFESGLKLALNTLKEKIPGVYDDMLIDSLTPTIKEAIKKVLLEQIEKISPLT